MGCNLSKFDGGNDCYFKCRQIYSEALQDIEKLGTEIRSTFELNYAMIMG